MVKNHSLFEQMGYESFLLSPALSLIVGIFLFFGLISFGSFFLSFFFKDEISNNKIFFLHSPLVGSNVLLAIFFPLASMGLLSNNILKLTSYLLLFLSIHFVINFFKISFSKIYQFKIFVFISMLYFFLCLAPFTHADTLDYHILSSVNLITTGSFSKTILPITNLLEGASETLIALSLISGSEQFANLVQFGGLLSIIAVFLSVKKESSHFLLLSVITTPCFIFFLSSPKPQLMQIANILFIFSFLFKKKLISINKEKIFVLFVIILTLNFLSKFSYILSSLFLFIFILSRLLSKYNYKILLSSLIVIFLIFILPDYYSSFKNFSSSPIDYMLSPLPPTLSGLSDTLKSMSEGSRIFPTWLIFPNNIGMLSTIIGPAILSFFLFRLNKSYIYFFFVFLFFVLVLSFSHASSRFLFEGFVILQFLLVYSEFKHKKYLIFFKNYIKLQSLACIGILVVLVFNLTPGAFSHKTRNQVMMNNANGYSLIKWANKHINENDVVISTDRSLSLFNAEAYNLQMLRYVDFHNQNSEIVSKLIKEKKVNRILIQSNVDPGKFYNCIGQLIATKKNVGSSKGRNPFNASKPYDASIYEFNYSDFPKCLF